MAGVDGWKPAARRGVLMLDSQTSTRFSPGLLHLAKAAVLVYLIASTLHYGFVVFVATPEGLSTAAYLQYAYQVYLVPGWELVENQKWHYYGIALSIAMVWSLLSLDPEDFEGGLEE